MRKDTYAEISAIARLNRLRAVSRRVAEVVKQGGEVVKQGEKRLELIAIGLSIDWYRQLSDGDRPATPRPVEIAGARESEIQARAGRATRLLKLLGKGAAIPKRPKRPARRSPVVGAPPPTSPTSDAWRDAYS